MPILVAALLGLVEGLTEYLPVSSTGHLILAGHFLGEQGEAAKSFEIVIQLGAILAVLVHYRALLWQRARELPSGKPEARRLLLALVAGFIPTAIVGLVARKWIKAHLFGARPVAIALIAGGIVMIAVELIRGRKPDDGETRLGDVTPLRGLLIGLGQCASLIPGTSRSMATIVTGQLTGLTTATAAEFSFLLALPTLGAATLYEAYKGRHELATLGALPMAVGMIVSFLVAWAVIAAFIAYLKRRGLVPFGLYRLVIGALVLWLVR
ncbi:MAG: Undecaprenyl-diphosphatase [Myxococcales bacterium]|nr:Undecaprenyl-diphosphatase [Myxococcales bacterium]